MDEAEVLKQAALLVAGFEGFSAPPYLDIGGVATIGYGTTIYPDGRHVTMDDAPVSQEQAQGFLAAHLASILPQVLAACPRLSGSRLVACLSFAYNEGVGAFSRSTMARLINADNYAAAADEFPKWTKAGGSPRIGLARRRAREREIFMSGGVA